MKTILILLLIGLGIFALGGLLGYTQKVIDENSIIPTIIPYPTKTPLNSDKLWNLVEKWRKSEELQPYIKDQRLCAIASDRVDDGLDNHKGLYEKYSSYPYVIQENSVWYIKTDEEEALTDWLNSPPHKATLEKPYKYSCIITNENDAVQIFSNF